MVGPGPAIHRRGFSVRVRKFVVAAGVVSGVVALSSAVAPSQAAPVRVDGPAVVVDDRSDMGHPADVRRVRAKHAGRSVVVRVKHEDLFPRGSASASVFFDTDAARPGAEFVLDAGLFLKPKFALSHAKGWQSTGRLANCGYAAALDFDKDVSWFRVKRSCFAAPDEVRVAVRVAGETDAGQWRTDWAGMGSRWTPWLVPAAT
jgi:hypothetical protein